MGRRPEPAKQFTFPEPRFRKVADSKSGKNAIKFFEYWGTLDADKSELAVVNCYRLFPVVDLQTVDPDSTDGKREGKLVWHTFRGAMPFAAEDYEEWLLNSEDFGSGDYKFILNEEGVDGYIMLALFSAMDMDAHPPKVDLRTCVWGSHRMEEYKKYLQRRNIRIPGIDDTESDDRDREEEEDMNIAGELARAAMDSAKESSQQLVEQTRRQAEIEIAAAKREATEGSGTMNNDAVRAFTSMIADGARTSLEIVKEHATVSNKQLDIVEVIKAVKDFYPAPGAGTDSAVRMMEMQQQSNLQIVTLMQGQVDFFKEMALRNMAPAAQPAGTVTTIVAPKTDIERMVELKQLSDQMGWSKASRVAEAVEPSKPWYEGIVENLPAIMTGLTTVFALGANIFYNLRKSDGTAMPPGEAVARAQGQQQAPPPAAGQSTQPSPEAMRALYIARMAPAFKNHYFGKTEGFNGYTFAEAMCNDFSGGPATDNGRVNYSGIKQMGVPGLVQMLQQSDAWPMLQGYVNQEDFKKFIVEFMGYEEWVASGQSESEPVKQ